MTESTSGTDQCQLRGCEEDADVEIRWFKTGRERIYCFRHADDALDGFPDTRVGRSVDTGGESDAE